MQKFFSHFGALRISPDNFRKAAAEKQLQAHYSYCAPADADIHYLTDIHVLGSARPEQSVLRMMDALIGTSAENCGRLQQLER
jgi:hypothetical protein